MLTLNRIDECGASSILGYALCLAALPSRPQRT
jgi:hypothetical protein